MIGWIAWAGAAEWPDLGAPPATAAGDGTRDAALVVAIEDYAAAQDLPGALANGRAWAAWLQQRSDGLPRTAEAPRTRSAGRGTRGASAT